MNHRTGFPLLLLLLTLSGTDLIRAAATGALPGPQAGDKVAFMGDSITQFGENPGGYVTLIVDALEKQGRKVVEIRAGVSGNTSKDMLARLDKDVLSKKPDWMTLSCGVNDVLHGVNGVPLDQYQQNITSIVDQASTAGIKVIVLTATMIHEDPADAFNQKLKGYNDFLRSLAAQRHLLLVDLNDDMRAALTQAKTETPNVKGNILTVDGVHMNGLGNEMMASGVLKVFGFTAAQLAEAKEGWLDLPNGTPLLAKGAMTARDYLKLRTLATGQGKSVDDLLGEILLKGVQENLAAPAPAPPGSP